MGAVFQFSAKSDGRKAAGCRPSCLEPLRSEVKQRLCICPRGKAWLLEQHFAAKMAQFQNGRRVVGQEANQMMNAWSTQKKIALRPPLGSREVSLAGRDLLRNKAPDETNRLMRFMQDTPSYGEDYRPWIRA